MPLAQAGAPWAVPAHIFAHCPQFVGSVLGSTQALPQFCSAAGQFSVQLPPLQTSPLLQVCPHAPQLAGSLLVLMHAPEHSAKPELHNVWQFPALQVALPLAGASQRLPQAPQLSASLCGSTQALPQASRGFAHVKLQLAFRQVAVPLLGASQRRPQAPQFCADACASTQALPQLSLSSVQLSEHAPFEQTLPGAHAWPQAPQCAGSLLTSMHAPAQA